MFRISFSAVTLLLATACQQEAQTPPILKQEKKWIELSDGSMYLETATDEEGHVLGANRCWPQGEEWDCLELIFGREDTLLAQRQSFNTLKSAADFPSAISGYHCSVAKHENVGWSISERIGGARGQRLVSNEVYPDQSPLVAGSFWSASFVQEILANNGIKGGKVFSCQALWVVLRDGSPASFKTTAVKIEDVGSLSRSNPSDPLAVE